MARIKRYYWWRRLFPDRG